MGQRVSYDTLVPTHETFMERDFEVFRAGPNEARSKRLHVTILKYGIIRMNRNVYYQIGRPAAVRLGYSRERDAIFIEPVSPRFNEAFPVIQDRMAWRINAAPFCRHFNITPDTTLKFVDPEIVGQTMLLKLHHTISVARPKRRRR